MAVCGCSPVCSSLVAQIFGRDADLARAARHNLTLEPSTTVQIRFARGEAERHELKRLVRRLDLPLVAIRSEWALLRLARAVALERAKAVLAQDADTGHVA